MIKNVIVIERDIIVFIIWIPYFEKPTKAFLEHYKNFLTSKAFVTLLIQWLKDFKNVFSHSHFILSIQVRLRLRYTTFYNKKIQTFHDRSKRLEQYSLGFYCTARTKKKTNRHILKEKKRRKFSFFFLFRVVPPHKLSTQT